MHYSLEQLKLQKQLNATNRRLLESQMIILGYQEESIDKEIEKLTKDLSEKELLNIGEN